MISFWSQEVILNESMTKRRNSFFGMQESMKRLSTKLEQSVTLSDRQRVLAEDKLSVGYDFCSICYSVEIQATGPIYEQDTVTVEFDCLHRFCIECCRETLREHIRNNRLQKLHCFHMSCLHPISIE